MVLFLMTKLVISRVFHKISCTFINRQAPHERMAYRCSFCGIIFDSISHRERHEQRHKVSSCNSLALFALGVKCQGYVPYCSFRTTTHLNAKTATRCSKTRRTWDTTTKPITSFRIRKRRQHLESKSLLLQIRFGRILLRQEKNIFHSELSNLDFACIYFYLINPTRKATERQKGPSEVPLPHVWHPCHVCPHCTQVLGDQFAEDEHWSILLVPD